MENQQNQQNYFNSHSHNPATMLQNDYYSKQHQKQDISSQQDYKWIQDFLAPSALFDYLPSNGKLENGHNEAKIVEICPESKQNQPVSKETAKRGRSIFHNFQKHLITLLKKLVYVRKVDISNKRYGVLALQLWKIFKQRREFSKKSLYLVFGVNQAQNEPLIARLAQNLPQFQILFAKYGCQEIEKAQALLRKIVIEQVSKLHKEIIQQQCKMNKFDQFYVYFMHFIQQLERDGLCKRLKKQQKLKVMQRNIQLFR